MPDSFDYTTGTNSEDVRLLQALIDEAPEYTEETNSRNADILKSIINNTEYTDAPQSEIEELLLRLKAKIGGEIEVDELNVTENGTYDAGVNKAYNPVNVELPLDSKTITENGTYTASEDNLAGYNEVTVAVEGYAKKSIANTPTPIATFNASALPMPSLTVGIEAVQAGNGDPSPTNVRPISGWSAVNVTRDANIMPIDMRWENFYLINAEGEKVRNTEYRCTANYIEVEPSTTYYIQVNYTTTGELAISVPFYADDESFISRVVVTLFTTSGIQGGAFTTPANCHYIKASIPNISKNPYLQKGSSYNGTTYTTTLKDGQGNPMTCYGGTLSNENGVQSLAVERVSEVFDGSNDEMWISDSNMTSEDGIVCFRAYLQNNNIKKPEGTASSINYIGKMFANIMPTLKNGYVNQYPMANTVMGITGYSGTDDNYFYINVNKTLSNIQSVADLRAWLAENPTTVVYELATPTQTPQDNLAIATQDGTNNLWADSGDIQSGEYMEAL